MDEDGVLICRMAYVCTRMGKKPPDTGRNTEGLYTFTSDNPRLFNIPPRDKQGMEKEYNKRTSVERFNKRKKEDYKLENGRHRSTKIWYCRLYGIMMFQYLDAWEMSSLKHSKKHIIRITRLILIS